MTSPGVTGPPVEDAPRLRSGSQSWSARLGRAILILVLFIVVPLAVAGWAGGHAAAIACTLGAVLALSSSMTNGRRATRFALPLMMLALVAGALTKPVIGRASEAPLDGWLWVVVVTGFAIASGLATRRGAGVAFATATLYAVVAPPIRDLGTLAVGVAFLLLGSLYGWLLASRLGAATVPPTAPASARAARLIALFLGIAVGLVCSLVVLLELPHSVWVATAVVVLGIPTPGLTERAILKRMLGQLGACAIVGIVSWVILTFAGSHASLLFGAATVLCALGYLMSLGRPITEQIAFLSAALMMPVAAKESQSVVWIVGDRLAYNIVGLAVMGAALVAVRLWAGEHPAPAAA